MVNDETCGVKNQEKTGKTHLMSKGFSYFTRRCQGRFVSSPSFFTRQDFSMW